MQDAASPPVRETKQPAELKSARWEDMVWTGKPAVLGPLGWAVSATAIATGTAIAVAPIRRVALGLIERAHYAPAIAWLIVVSASII
jgi:hypothetical protein